VPTLFALLGNPQAVDLHRCQRIKLRMPTSCGSPASDGAAEDDATPSTAPSASASSDA
jgi:hypothetical protein